MATSTKSYSHRDYTVAWVCALPLEMTAAVAMLDERHRDLPVKQNDDNAYILGKIHPHNVVMACLPLGVYGTTSATAVAAQMRYSFESIRFFLMVGIGGGAPSKNNDIRLGDVVVSKPLLNCGGVIQYDFGKALSGDRFEHTGVLNKPPTVLLSAISKLKADQRPSPSSILSLVSKITPKRPNEEQAFAYPGASQDILFEHRYDHPGSEETCRNCDMGRLIQRTPRDEHGPKIHYGLIASGNQVIKNSRTRDRLAQEHDILCFEMEAAGLMDNFPCLVIRGICDYSDSHKNKQWQNYAAATAASYARELLSVVHGRQVEDTPPAELDLSFYIGNIPDRMKAPMDLISRRYTDEELLEKISDYEHNKIHSKLSKKRLEGTTEWFLEHPVFKDWFFRKEISSLWCSGKIGSGKTMIATAVIDAAKSQPSETISPIFFFYCDYEYHEKLDASGIISSLIKQICEYLYKKSGRYPENVTEDLHKFFGLKRTKPDFDDLQKIFSQLCRDTLDTVYVIDGIDALQEAHATSLLECFQKLFCSPNIWNSSRILLLSRDQVPGYVNIGTFIRGISEIPISTNAVQDIENYIKTSVTEKMMYRKLTDDVSLLEKVKKTLLTESSNMFLWVYLQLEILWDTCRTDADIRHALTTLPKNIGETYRRCVCRIDFQDGCALKVLKWVSFAKRPLQIEELREAVAFQPTDTKWDAEKKPQRDFIIGCCANLVVLDPIDNCVRFAHSSVKQYLEEDRNKEAGGRSVPGYLTAENGDLECGEYCITYLAFSDFSLQLSKITPRKADMAVPSPYLVVQSVSTTKLHKLLFWKSQNHKKSVSVPVPPPTAPSRAQYKFLDYAVASWALHTRKIQCKSLKWEEFRQLATYFNTTWNFHPWVSGGRSKVSYLHGLFGWAVRERHKPLLSLVSDDQTSLHLFCNLPLIDEGLPAIHIASKFGDEEIVEILVTFCDVNKVDQDGYTPLHHAAIKGHTNVVRLLLLQNKIACDINSIADCTPLWLAASHGHDDIVSLLIEKGAKIEVKDNIFQRTPLWRAVKNGHCATANLLLENGAQIECCDTSRQKLLELALINIDLPMIDLLKSRGARFESMSSITSTKLLQWATRNKARALVTLLIENNTAFNVKKLIPLLIESGDLALSKIMIEKATNFQINEITPFVLQIGDLSLLKLLIENMPEFQVNKFISLVFQSGALVQLKMLIEKMEGPSDHQLLSQAISTSCRAAVELLLERDIDLNMRDEHNSTALHMATRNRDTTIMAVLLKKRGQA